MLLGCGSAEKSVQKNTYFAWSAFLKQQINGFAQSNQRVHKTVVMDGKKEVKIVSNVDWEKEFALYLEADLNKPAYEKSYDNLSEPGFYWYSLKKDESLPVKKMIIHLDADDLLVGDFSFTNEDKGYDSYFIPVKRGSSEWKARIIFNNRNRMSRA